MKDASVWDFISHHMFSNQGGLEFVLLYNNSCRSLSHSLPLSLDFPKESILAWSLIYRTSIDFFEIDSLSGLSGMYVTKENTYTKYNTIKYKYPHKDCLPLVLGKHMRRLWQNICHFVSDNISLHFVQGCFSWLYKL